MISSGVKLPSFTSCVTSSHLSMCLHSSSEKWGKQGSCEGRWWPHLQPQGIREQAFPREVKDIAQRHTASQARVLPRPGAYTSPPRALPHPLSSWPISKTHIAEKSFFWCTPSYSSTRSLLGPAVWCVSSSVTPTLLWRAPNHSFKYPRRISQLTQSPG